MQKLTVLGDTLQCAGCLQVQILQVRVVEHRDRGPVGHGILEDNRSRGVCIRLEGGEVEIND